MTEKEFREFLTELLEVYTDGFADEDSTDEDSLPVEEVLSFKDAEIMTTNEGMVVRMRGAEFQVTIVRTS